MDDSTRYRRHDVQITDRECGNDIQVQVPSNCVHKPVSAGAPEPEPSQRNAFDVLMAGSSSKPRKSLPSAKMCRCYTARVPWRIVTTVQPWDDQSVATVVEMGRKLISS